MITALSTCPGRLKGGSICIQGGQSTYLDWSIPVHLPIGSLRRGGPRRRIDNLVGVMGDLHAYIADSCSAEKIASYKDTLRTVH